MSSEDFPCYRKHRAVKHVPDVTSKDQQSNVRRIWPTLSAPELVHVKAMP